MISDFFINGVILIAFTFIAGHVLKDIPKEKLNSAHGRLILGFFSGLLGILMMIYTIEVEGTTTLLDLRIFAIMMASFIGGFLSTIAAGVVIGTYRVLHYGINISSTIAVIQTLLYIIFYFLIDKKIRIEWKRWFLKTLVSLTILMSCFSYLLKNIEDKWLIFLQFSIFIIIAGILEYILLEYVKNSNELYRRYKKASTKDYLTGLYNTRQFDIILNDSYKRVRENNENLSCFMIDIDYFKKVNDTYGHAVGDIVLHELANILRRTCRNIDIIARVGGEEFCVLLMDCPNDHAFEVALRIRNAVREEKISIGSNNFISITVSIGVATYPDNSFTLESIKERADEALYKAKNSGRDKVCSHDVCVNTNI